MASVIDSLRNFSNDKGVVPKMIILFLPILLLFFMDTQVQNYYYILGGIVYYFIGYLIVAFHEAIKSNEVYIPNPLTSIVSIVFRGFVGMLCIVPISVATFYIILWFEHLDTIAEIKYLSIIFALLIYFSVAMVQLTLYAKDYSPMNAFNFKVIFDVGGDFLLQLFKLFVQIIVCILIPAYLVYLGGESGFNGMPEAFIIFKEALYAFTTLIVYLVSIDFFIQLYEQLIISKEDMDYLHL